MSETPDSNKKEYYFELGIKELDAGNIEKAIEAFQQAIMFDPTDTRSYCNLGIAYELLRDYDKAREAYEKAIALNPTNAVVLNNLAALTHYSGNPKAAAFLFESAIASDPLYIEPYLNIARMFMELNLFPVAESYIRKILEIEPGSAEALNLLGVITNVTHRPHEAVGHFQNALRSDANQPSFFSNLGTALKSIGDLRRAIMALEKAEELNPNSLSTMNNLGALYRETGNLDKAEHFLTRAIAYYPENPFPHLNLAEVFLAKGDYNRALPHLKKYIALVPLDMDTLFKTCGIARMADRLEEVVMEMKSFVREADPADPRKDVVRGWLKAAKIKKDDPAQ
ncbi:MAG: tetratricopeptide repeat protein [Candidatus Latescibacter sp.]|nr:tetratricopeptide repeat protein [Candidatus Latescibacter sp.]